MILDGMTQATTSIPRCRHKPKWISTKTKLNQHNMGCLTEGYPPCMELTTENIKNGANALVDSVQRAIHRVRIKIRIFECAVNVYIYIYIYIHTHILYIYIYKLSTRVLHLSIIFLVYSRELVTYGIQ